MMWQSSNTIRAGHDASNSTTLPGGQHARGREGLFLFIALRWMQDPEGWWCGWLKISKLAWGFSDGHSIIGSQETSCINRKGFLLFLSYGTQDPSVLSVWSVVEKRRKIPADLHAGESLYLRINTLLNLCPRNILEHNRHGLLLCVIKISKAHQCTEKTMLRILQSIKLQ